MTIPIRENYRASKAPRGAYRRKLRLAALAAAGILAVAIGLYVRQRTAGPKLPAVPLAGADPAVVKTIEAARAAVRQAPRSAQAWGKLGMVLFAHGFYNQGSTCFEQAEKLDPREPRWPYFQGALLSLQDAEAAIAKLRRAAELCAGEPDVAGLRLGETLLAQGRLDEAEEQFRQLLRKNPANGRAQLDLGRLAYWRGEPQKSLEHLRQAAQDPHTRQAAQLLLAEVCQHSGDPRAAEAYRRRAADPPADLPWTDPFDAEVQALKTGEQANLIRQGQLMDQGRMPEALALLQQTVRDYPDSARSWGLFGDALVKIRDLPRAEEALLKAMQLGSDSVEVPLDLGLVYLLRGDRRTAQVYFRRALERKPDFALAHYYIGSCLLQEGDRAGALEAFQAALRCKPDFVQAHRAAAELLVEAGKNGEALLHLRYALQFAPDDQRARDLLGQVLRRITIPAGP